MTPAFSAAARVRRSKTEADFRRITYDVTVSEARTLVNANPNMTFIYLSGKGTDSTENGSQMRARVKGATETAVHAMGFTAMYAFRPGIIQPLDGIVSSTTIYRVVYFLLTPFVPLIRAALANRTTDTRSVEHASARR